MTRSTARECGELVRLVNAPSIQDGASQGGSYNRTCQNLRAVVVKCCCFWSEVFLENVHGSAILQGFIHWGMAILGPDSCHAGMIPEVSKRLVSG